VTKEVHVTYHSQLFDIDVREEIAREFTDAAGRVDDMMAGLHEVRARLAEAGRESTSEQPHDPGLPQPAQAG